MPASFTRAQNGSNRASKGLWRPVAVVGAAGRITIMRAPAVERPLELLHRPRGVGEREVGRGEDAALVVEGPVLGEPPVERAEGDAHRLRIVLQRLLVDHPERGEEEAPGQPLVVEHAQPSGRIAVLRTDGLVVADELERVHVVRVATEVLAEAAGLRDRVEGGVGDRPAHLAADHVVLPTLDRGPLHGPGTERRVEVAGEGVERLVVVVVGVPHRVPEVVHARRLRGAWRRNDVGSTPSSGTVLRDRRRADGAWVTRSGGTGQDDSEPRPRATAVAGGGPRHGAGSARGRVRGAERSRDLPGVARRRASTSPTTPTAATRIHRTAWSSRCTPVRSRRVVEFELERTGQGTLVTSARARHRRASARPCPRCRGPIFLRNKASLDKLRQRFEPLVVRSAPSRVRARSVLRAPGAAAPGSGAAPAPRQRATPSRAPIAVRDTRDHHAPTLLEPGDRLRRDLGRRTAT